MRVSISPLKEWMRIALKEAWNLIQTGALFVLSNPRGTTMKLATIALTTVFALSSTLALAHGHKRHHHHHMGYQSMNSGGPNGTAGGPTSLSGTGSSQYGGSVPGNTGKN
jgi:hypothetical protein